MASKDRKQRLKDDTRRNILDAALRIGKDEGWQALSMRKIADIIEYTPPVIYEYFANKEALMLQLTKLGYCMLAKDMREARDKHTSPEKQLEDMWLTYWNFAFTQKELYQLMFGIEVNCCVWDNSIPEAEVPANMIWEVIGNLMGDAATEDLICKRYYTFWSVVHGLISINLVRQGVPDGMNEQVLKDAIGGIIHAIKG
ncbi:TetR/AcrR family transcriptional regulator [Mucilaginibacter myungsuensis]|uniref:TetR/AcrR family transcriptional regulator n=1 Tax=Mucilaginibacter myungsuensis TaxID=649104 RepID=A0A929PZG0_9SPHI|nr:TetR/AcrR family transcriptional regulator [Mucilaginibacter myungsuensis]MBE9664460.1 TetR/AcrR family transcriptional regulator [Mucilaginibacter myungsuensis]MDN3601395.1 TetR/AcrR family transcriptional regulator [Mucilaginibacter myungsuensis]